MSLGVHPNPSNDWWNISVSHSGHIFYSLTDTYGKILETGSHANDNWRMDNRNLTPDIYFLKVKNSEFERTFKLVKQ